MPDAIATGLLFSVREGKKLHTVMSVRAEDERTMALLRKVRCFRANTKNTSKNFTRSG